MPSPAADSLWQSIIGPLEGPLAGAWWAVLHLVVPGVIIVAVAIGAWAAITGNKNHMGRARGALIGIPVMLILAGVAILVANWAVSSYA